MMTVPQSSGENMNVHDLFAPQMNSVELLRLEKGAQLSFHERAYIEALAEQEKLVLDFIRTGFAEGKYTEDEVKAAVGYLNAQIREKKRNIINGFADLSFQEGLYGKERAPLVSLEGPRPVQDFKRHFESAVAEMGQKGYVELNNPHDARIDQVHQLLRDNFAPDEIIPSQAIRLALQDTQDGKRNYFVNVFYDQKGTLGGNRVRGMVNGDKLRLGNGDEAVVCGYRVNSKLTRSSEGTKLGTEMERRLMERNPQVRYSVGEATTASMPFHFAIGRSLVAVRNKAGKLEQIPYFQPPADFDANGMPTYEGVMENFMLSDRKGEKAMPVGTLLEIVSKIYETWYFPKQRLIERKIRAEQPEISDVDLKRKIDDSCAKGRQEVLRYFEQLRSWLEERGADHVELLSKEDFEKAKEDKSIKMAKETPRESIEIKEDDIARAARELVLEGKNETTITIQVRRGKEIVPMEFVLTDETDFDQKVYDFLAKAFPEEEVESPETTTALFRSKKLKNTMGGGFSAYMNVGAEGGGHLPYDYLYITLRNPKTKKLVAVAIGNYLGGTSNTQANVVLPENMLVAKPQRGYGLNKIIYRIYEEMGKLYAARNKGVFQGIDSERNVPVEMAREQLLEDSSINAVTRLIISGKLGQMKIAGKYQQASLGPGQAIANQPRLVTRPRKEINTLTLPQEVFQKVVAGFEQYSMRKEGPHLPQYEAQFKETQRSVGLRTKVELAPTVELNEFTAVAYLAYELRYVKGDSELQRSIPDAKQRKHLRELMYDAYEYLQHGKAMPPQRMQEVCNLIHWINESISLAKKVNDARWEDIKNNPATRSAQYKEYILEVEKGLKGLVDGLPNCDPRAKNEDVERKNAIIETELRKAEAGQSTMFSIVPGERQKYLVVRARGESLTAGFEPYLLKRAIYAAHPDINYVVYSDGKGAYHIEFVAHGTEDARKTNLKYLAWEMNTLDYLNRIKNPNLIGKYGNVNGYRPKDIARMEANMGYWSDEGNFSTGSKQSTLTMDQVIVLLEKHSQVESSPMYRKIIELAHRRGEGEEEKEFTVHEFRAPLLAYDLAHRVLGRRPGRGQKISVEFGVRRLIDEGENIGQTIKFLLELKEFVNAEKYPQAFANFARMVPLAGQIEASTTESGRSKTYETVMFIAEQPNLATLSDEQIINLLRENELAERIAAE